MIICYNMGIALNPGSMGVISALYGLMAIAAILYAPGYLHKKKTRAYYITRIRTEHEIFKRWYALYEAGGITEEELEQKKIVKLE